MSEINKCIIRQLHSSNIAPGTAEFDMAIRNRIWRPESDIRNHLNKSSLDCEVMIAMAEMEYYEFERLLEFYKSCKRNKGLSVYMFCEITGMSYGEVRLNGKKCVAMMVSTTNPVDFLDGSDSLFCPDNPIQGESKYNGYNWSISLG